MSMGLQALALCLLLSPGVFSQTSKYVGEIPAQRPSLINMFLHTSSNVRQKHSLLVSSYSTDRSSYDSAYVLMYPGEHMAANFSGFGTKNIYNFLYWPKEVRQVPRDVFGMDAVVHLDGSTIIGKTTGSVYTTDLKDFNFPATYDIAAGRIPVPANFMYHSGFWRQIDVGGTVDFVGCRSQIENGMLRYAQLFWLDHPRAGMDGNWNLNVMKESACDTSLAEIDIRLGIADNYEVIYATGVHTKRLTFFYTTGVGNPWTNPDNIMTGVLETGREYNDLQIVDVNRDGNPDILVTVQAQSGGTVEVFEIPNDFRVVANYRRHVIADGFVSRNGGANGRTPGVARPFYPTANRARKPWIYVSGGDDGRAYYLRPLAESATNWNYETVIVADHGASQQVAGVASGDIDGDGNEELFVSVHAKNKVEVYSFRP